MDIDQEKESECLNEVDEASLTQVTGGVGGEATDEEIHQIFQNTAQQGREYADNVGKHQGVNIPARLVGSVARTGLEFIALAGGAALANKAAPKKH